MNSSGDRKFRILYNLDFPRTGVFRDYKGLQSIAKAFGEMGHIVREMRTEEELTKVLREFRPNLFIFYFHWLGNPGRNVSTVPWDLKYLNSYKRDNDLKVFIRGAALNEAETFFRNTPVWKEELKQFLRYNIDDFPNTFQRKILKSGTVDCWLSLYTERYTTLFGKYFAEFGIDSFSVPLAVDCTNRFRVAPISEYQCQVVYVGGYWKYKGRTLDKYLLPLLEKYSHRVYGRGWEQFGYDVLPNRQYNKMLASGLVAPCIQEPHAFHFQHMLYERPWQVIACGGFPIYPHPHRAVREYFLEDEVICAENDIDYFEKVHRYASNPSSRFSYMTKALDKVMRQHTYHHRAQKILHWIESRKSSK